MWLFDLLFGSSNSARYGFYISREQAKKILSSIVKDKFVYGTNLASQLISELEANSATSKLVYGNDLISQLRETELMEIIKFLHSKGYISVHYKTAYQAEQEALREIRGQKNPKIEANMTEEGNDAVGQRGSEVDAMTRHELERPKISDKDLWRI